MRHILSTKGKLAEKVATRFERRLATDPTSQ